MAYNFRTFLSTIGYLQWYVENLQYIGNFNDAYYENIPELTPEYLSFISKYLGQEYLTKVLHQIHHRHPPKAAHFLRV